MELWPEDWSQCVYLALVKVGASADVKTIGRAVSNELDSLMRELGTNNTTVSALSNRRTNLFSALRMREAGATGREINAALGAGAANLAAKHSSTTRYRGDKGNAARWGDYAPRRAKAREMRGDGATLKQIAEACGYRSIASAHYAVSDR